MSRSNLAFAASLIAATLTAAAAGAQEPPAPAAQPPAVQAEGPAPQPEVKIVPPAKKICKSILRTNSRVDYIRVCLTKEEWDDVRARHRDGMDELLRAHDNPNPAGN